MSLLDGFFGPLPVRPSAPQHDHALLTIDLEDDGSIVCKYLVEGCLACEQQPRPTCRVCHRGSVGDCRCMYV